MGADAIKIEDTGAGDYASPTVRALVNRNKRGLRLDLKQPAGKHALLQLCRGNDRRREPGCSRSCDEIALP